eukprot:CAMPEP_0172432288 /NCGR_PEP_ID=MMETSP1064-20121228/62470_1 /TAXON_ID=202472 /ORGANISM="Aulacoseira subarctica , Strain CCAP 1002/5" /LENGTH=62 /DNA_ID=CAMNT_0013179483 /DNA_START=102 /DNA_END=287 /DNA_ORIENTATION=-
MAGLRPSARKSKRKSTKRARARQQKPDSDDDEEHVSNDVQSYDEVDDLVEDVAMYENGEEDG